MVYDVAVIGAGIVGTAIFNKLIRVGEKVVLIEKNNDVATGTTKANSGIVHAGFDAHTGTLKAKLNVRGAQLYPSLCEELHVPYMRNGALVIGDDINVVEELYERGYANGVQGLQILNRDAILKMLPSITDNITCGLYAGTSAIVSPYSMAIALADEGILNGGTLLLNFDTKHVSKESDGYHISDGKQMVIARSIVLACGGEHNSIASIFGATQYDIKYRRGEYYLLDVNACDVGGYTIFPLPSSTSKGVLVSPTCSGNIIVGPTSTLSDNNSTRTTIDGLQYVKESVSRMLTNVDLRKTIRVFAGVRTLVGDDFVIERDKNNPDIICVAGICSPGLTAAPAIAEEVVKLLNLDLNEKKMKRLPEIKTIRGQSAEDIDRLISIDSNYGKIVCRCECVSEAEIVQAIHTPTRPMSIDAIKRRVRAGMGRCQGGFCFSRVMEILAREYHVSIDDIVKENKNSRVIIGDIN